MTEIPVAGFDGKYAVRSDGHIYCYSRANVNAKREYPFQVSESVGSSGYLFVALIKGKRITHPVHRIICSAFHGPQPGPKMVVRHLDGNKLNNLPGNLAWGTYSQNEADKKRHGTTARGIKQGSAKLTDEGVKILRASIPYGLWDVMNAAKVFGVDPSTIRRVASGKGWEHVE